MDHLFANDKIYHPCVGCGRLLPNKYEQDKCDVCQEQELFEKVRDYIRNNVVNEYDVTMHFNIPLRKVKKWIKEGRIEYCDKGTSSIYGVKCQMCGKSITFGTLCQQCLKKVNKGATLGYDNFTKPKEDRIYFLDEK